MSQTRQQPNNDEQPPTPPRNIRWRWIAVGCVVFAILAAITIAAARSDSEPKQPAKSANMQSGLPDAPDYHSLIIAPDDAEHVVLGTREGLFESTDAGKTWRQTGALEGDAMNLARDAKNTKLMYAAGHQLLKKSTDGGTTWTDIPLDDSIAQTLANGGGKAVDIHGFASDPTNANTVYAAVAGLGLYKSTDAGTAFTKVSDTGAAGFGIAIANTTPRSIYLADAQRGLLLSEDNGESWKPVQQRIIGVAVSSTDPKRVIAAGDALYLATDGRNFQSVQASDGDGFGPVAIAPSNPKIAYAIELNGTLHVSDDGGSTWIPR